MLRLSKVQIVSASLGTGCGMLLYRSWEIISRIASVDAVLLSRSLHNFGLLYMHIALAGNMFYMLYLFTALSKMAQCPTMELWTLDNILMETVSNVRCLNSSG